MTSSSGTIRPPTQIAAVVVFAIIEFLLIIVPWAFLELKPEAIKGTFVNNFANGPSASVMPQSRPSPKRHIRERGITAAISKSGPGLRSSSRSA
jgi:hypothetical protein